MDFWRRLAEQRIERALKAGEFDSLATEGRPLDLDENPFEGGRAMAHKLLKNAGLLPRWIGLDRELRGERVALRSRLQVARQRHPLGGPEWERTVEDFQHAVVRFNQKVCERNRLAPRAAPPLLALQREREIRQAIRLGPKQMASS